jgi:hypothetical protein
MLELAPISVAVGAERGERPPFRPGHPVAVAVLRGEALAHPLGRLVQPVGQEGFELEVHGGSP